MGKYRCHNSKCKECGKDIIGNTHIVYKTEGTIDKGASCPECGEIREMIFDGIPQVLAKGNANIYTGKKRNRL